MHSRLQADLASGALAEALADIAEEAAAVILPYWRSGVVAERKGDDSPVTLADQEAEALILERLEVRWPGVQAVAEEKTAAEGAPETVEDWFWLIDPLDGTRGFVEGRESFTVNIGLIHDRAPVAGVVATPATGMTWIGRGPGLGAAKRRFGGTWQAVAVRARPKRAQALTSHSLDADEAAALSARHGCLDWRGEDSSLKFCLIAEGAADCYPRLGPTSEWDTAAGQAVLEAAGGRVVDGEGRPLRYGKPGFGNRAFTAFGG